MSICEPTVLQSPDLLLQPDVAARGAACLVKIYPAGGVGGLVELSAERMVIGRERGCDLELADESISRRHALLERLADGYVLADLGSRNGTYVNDVRIDSQRLAARDRIRCGNHIFKFLCAGDVEAQYHEAVYLLMTTDGLTSAYNRRYLMDVLARDLSRARRWGRPLSLLMIDIDHFKHVNDAHGHMAGDEVLQELSRRVRAALRNDEMLARYGGEEFAVVMPEADPAEARKLAERLRRLVADERFTTETARVAATVSIGIATSSGAPSETAAELIQRADARLYEAKRLGRNRVQG